MSYAEITSSRRSVFGQVLTQPVFGVLLRHRGGCIAVVSVMAVMVIFAAMGVQVWWCPWLNLTGVACPGCGMTRSVGAVVCANPDDVWRSHVFGPFLVFIGFLFLLGAVLPSRLRDELSEKVGRFERRTALWAVGTVLMLVYYALRMAGYLGGMVEIHV